MARCLCPLLSWLCLALLSKASASLNVNAACDLEMKGLIFSRCYTQLNLQTRIYDPADYLMNFKMDGLFFEYVNGVELLRSDIAQRVKDLVFNRLDPFGYFIERNDVRFYTEHMLEFCELAQSWAINDPGGLYGCLTEDIRYPKSCRGVSESTRSAHFITQNKLRWHAFWKICDDAELYRCQADYEAVCSRQQQQTLDEKRGGLCQELERTHQILDCYDQHSRGCPFLSHIYTSARKSRLRVTRRFAANHNTSIDDYGNVCTAVTRCCKVQEETASALIGQCVNMAHELAFSAEELADYARINMHPEHVRDVFEMCGRLKLAESCAQSASVSIKCSQLETLFRAKTFTIRRYCTAYSSVLSRKTVRKSATNFISSSGRESHVPSWFYFYAILSVTTIAR